MNTVWLSGFTNVLCKSFLLYRLFLLSWQQEKVIALCCFCQMRDEECKKMSVILVLSLELWESSSSQETSYSVTSDVHGKLSASYFIVVQQKMKLLCILLKPFLGTTAWHGFSISDNPAYLYSCPGAWPQINHTSHPWEEGWLRAMLYPWYKSEESHLTPEFPITFHQCSSTHSSRLCWTP